MEITGILASIAVSTMVGVLTKVLSSSGLMMSENPFGNGMKAAFMLRMAKNAPPGPISPVDGVHAVTLVRKQTLVEEVPGKICPVRTFTFVLPKDKESGVDLASAIDLGLGQIVKLHLRPNAEDQNFRTMKSYSPTRVSKDGELDLTVKIYPGGSNSEYLDNLSLGDTINVSGPWPLTLPRRNMGNKVNLVAFGVGLTEIYPVARSELERSPSSRVHVLYSNRHQEDSFFGSEMKNLERKYGKRFQLTKIFSRDDNVSDALHGRVDGAILSQVFGLNNLSVKEREDQRFVVVGSKPMIQVTWATLRSLGFSQESHSFLKK